MWSRIDSNSKIEIQRVVLENNNIISIKYSGNKVLTSPSHPGTIQVLVPLLQLKVGSWTPSSDYINLNLLENAEPLPPVL